MDDEKKEVIEALETLVEYSAKLLNALTIIPEELRGNRQPDTDEYLKNILKGLNWEIQVINSTMGYLNEEEKLIDNAQINEVLKGFNDAFEKKDDAEIADQLENKIAPLVKQFEEVAKKRIA